jgi:hypothetical protein
MRIRGHGRSADLPPRWEGRIYRRGGHDADATEHPVLHAASFALPNDRGDYGSGAVDRMRADDVFVALVEFDAEAAGTDLFARDDVPWPVSADAFSPRRLQRHIAGQSGCQFFFSHGGRAFCLYVVLGSHASRDELVGEANVMLSTVELDDDG